MVALVFVGIMTPKQHCGSIYFIDLSLIILFVIVHYDMKFLLRYIIPIFFFFVGVRHCAATYRIEELCTLVCKNIIFLPFVA